MAVAGLVDEIIKEDLQAAQRRGLAPALNVLHTRGPRPLTMRVRMVLFCVLLSEKSRSV